MPFASQHVKPAELDDLVVLLRHGLFSFLQGLRPGGLVLIGGLFGVEAPGFEGSDGSVLGISAEHDVGSAPGHVGRDSDRAFAPGLGDDGGFPLVLLGVEHLVGNARLMQKLRQLLGLLHARRADEDGLADVVALLDVLHDRLELALAGREHIIDLVLANHRHVRGDRNDAELVGRGELLGLCLGGSGHARKLVVQAEVVLERDRGESLILGLDLHAFLRLDRLMHALVVPAPGQDSPGVLVDDEDLAVADDVILVPVEKLLGLDRVVEVADERRVERFV